MRYISDNVEIFFDKEKGIICSVNESEFEIANMTIFNSMHDALVYVFVDNYASYARNILQKIEEIQDAYKNKYALEYLEDLDKIRASIVIHRDLWT